MLKRDHFLGLCRLIRAVNGRHPWQFVASFGLACEPEGCLSICVGRLEYRELTGLHTLHISFENDDIPTVSQYAVVV